MIANFNQLNVVIDLQCETAVITFAQCQECGALLSPKQTKIHKNWHEQVAIRLNNGRT